MNENTMNSDESNAAGTSNNANHKPTAATSFSPLLGTPAMPVNIKVQKPPETTFARLLNYLQIIVTIVFLLFLCFSLYTLINSKDGGLNAFSGNPTNFMVQRSTVRFTDVQGCDEVKAQLEQIVDYIRYPGKYGKFGAEMPRGYLLQGPPGVGKTLLAKAVAGEADVPFYSISGAEFEEVYVGVGASRVRSLFRAARDNGQAVIFIDEIDAVGGKRNARDGSAHRQTLNQLLVEMDGFHSHSGIVVLAATNSVESIDPALLRPGRFDHTLSLHLPDIKGRIAILKMILGKLPRSQVDPKVEIEPIARVAIGYSGADLAQVVNQAKLYAALDKSANKITMEHLNRAVTFVSLGPARKLTLSQEERERTAYHESGHAIVALATEGTYPIQTATIVPHGNALGMVVLQPDADMHSMTKSQLQGIIDYTLGGFAAEEMHGGGVSEVSLGPGSDLAQANRIARQMVHAGFGKTTRFLQLTDPETASNSMKEAIEKDIQTILDESKQRATTVLQRERKAWEAMAKTLLDKETMTRDDIYALWNVNKSPNLLKATNKGTGGTGKPSFLKRDLNEDATDSEKSEWNYLKW